MSSKEDVPIRILSEEASNLGIQVLSFDLPEHGDRKDEATLCKIEECVFDLNKIYSYAQNNADNIRLCANSMGAYFSLSAYKNKPIRQSLFLSPVLDMERLIHNMMEWFSIVRMIYRLKVQFLHRSGKHSTGIYYQYVINNPITKWDVPTSILYGRHDNICEYETVKHFSEKHSCELIVSDNSEHYFHTDNDMLIYRNWLR
jgi:alpha-beta hydrolase superfamily lysophospholipase